MYLKKIDFFSELNEESLQKLDYASTLLKLDSGDKLFYEGERSESLYVLISGVIRMFKTDSKGRQIFIHQFTPVSLIGELACFEKIPYPATAEAVIKCEVAKINFLDFSQCLLKNSDISLKIIQSLLQKVKILSNVIHHELILTAEAKIAKLLVEDTEIFAQLKNTKIAAILNTTPETLSRTLTKFKRMLYIQLDENNELQILDKNSLEILYK